MPHVIHRAPTRNYQILAIAAAVAAYLLVLLGGLVRISGSGLACPDWPLCRGHLIPPLEGRVLIEYSHRLVAASVSVLVLATALAAFRVRRSVPYAAPVAALVLILVAVQIVLGGLTVKLALTPSLVALHLGVAMLFLAGLILQAAVAIRPSVAVVPAAFRRLVAWTAAATYVQVLIGGYVGSSAAALACPDLPLCRGVLLPSDPPASLQMLHRAWGVVVVVLVLATARAASRTGVRAVTATAALAAAIAVVQAAVGALNVLTRLVPIVQGTHLGLAAALFGTLVTLGALSGLAWQPAGAARQASSHRRPVGTIAGGSGDDSSDAMPWPSGPVTRTSVGATIRDYLALMKPRIILLLLITTCTTMIVASAGHLDLRILLLTVIGGTLAAGSANAFNMYVDRDIDAVMRRTCLRPVPAGRLQPGQAVVFGLLIGLLSVGIMAWGVNALSAALSTAGIIFYVGVYTLWLKRTTPQNIVIGGAAGSIPPLVGWAAATGSVGLPAAVLFGIVFLWTPPHFWALALGKTEDYRVAGVPMLPVVRGDQVTRRQIFLYSILLSAATLLLVFPLHTLGSIYLCAALLLDGVFVALALAVLRRRDRAESALFGYSILYLALLFGAMVADRLAGR
jgi:heme o synthase